MTYGVDIIIPVCHDDDNDGVDTTSGSSVTYASTAQGLYSTLPTSLTARDQLVVQMGGWSRDYSAAGEGGFGIGVFDHDYNGSLNMEQTTSTTSYTMDADILSKQYIFTPHSDLVTHASSTKKQCWIGIRKSIAVNARSTAMGILTYVLKAP